MVSAIPRPAILSALVVTYLGVSAICWFGVVPSVAPALVPFASSLVGPPAMLLWGRGAVIPFAVASVLLFVALYRALRDSRRLRLWLIAAAVVWLGSGFYSYAVSI